MDDFLPTATTREILTAGHVAWLASLRHRATPNLSVAPNGLAVWIGPPGHAPVSDAQLAAWAEREGVTIDGHAGILYAVWSLPRFTPAVVEQVRDLLGRALHRAVEAHTGYDDGVSVLYVDAIYEVRPAWRSAGTIAYPTRHALGFTSAWLRAMSGVTDPQDPREHDSLVGALARIAAWEAAQAVAAEYERCPPGSALDLLDLG